ncbi:MAG: hypothetical protein WD845_09045 [Pirellulales bacterium]
MPLCMIFRVPSFYLDESIAGGFESLNGTGHICETISGDIEVTGGAVGSETVYPDTGCADIDDWHDTLPGAALGYWKLEVLDWAEFYCNHVGGVGDFGCCDNEGFSVHLCYQLALRTILVEDVPKCYFFGQVAFYTSDAPVPLCHFYNYVGELDISVNGGGTCDDLLGTYSMVFDMASSSVTDADGNVDCWGCTVTQNPPHTGGLVLNCP